HQEFVQRRSVQPHLFCTLPAAAVLCFRFVFSAATASCLRAAPLLFHVFSRLFRSSSSAPLAMRQRTQASILPAQIICLERTVRIRRVSPGEMLCFHHAARLLFDQGQELRNRHAISSRIFRISAEIT